MAMNSLTVKGLVDAGITEVPAVFHHSPEALAPSLVSTDVTIPLIDLSAGRSEVVAAVKAAAQSLGFFQVVHHGVPEEHMSAMLAAVRRFHEEPVEVKTQYSRDAGRCVLYNCDPDMFQSLPARWRDTLYMDDPDQLAAEVLPRACRGVAPEYVRLMRRLGHLLFELLSEALGVLCRHLEEEARCMETLSVFGHYYPACPQPRLTLGAGKHTDASFATVLLQDGVGGLQVLVGDAWVNVPVVTGALVVNVGDFMQVVSNGKFRSVVHRVVPNSVGPRITVASFFRASGATVCAPVVGAGPPLYKTVTAEVLRSASRGQRLCDLRI